VVDAWPGTLPQLVQIDGFSSGNADGRLSTNMDTGPAKMRRRTSASIRPLAATIQCTGAQLATLRTFVDTTLLGGSLPFTFPAPEDGSSLLVRFSDQGLPTWNNLGGDTWQAAFKLDVLP
jgi:hypothetical protein